MYLYIFQVLLVHSQTLRTIIVREVGVTDIVLQNTPRLHTLTGSNKIQYTLEFHSDFKSQAEHFGPILIQHSQQS